MHIYQNILSLLYIILGIVIFIFFLGDLIFKIIFGLAGLWLLNKGLMLRGSQQLKTQAMSFFFRNRWF